MKEVNIHICLSLVRKRRSNEHNQETSSVKTHEPHRTFFQYIQFKLHQAIRALVGEQPSNTSDISPLPMVSTVNEPNNPFLPGDVIVNILKRLPAKSLIRFQCVCKDWKNLIKTSSFIQDHLHHSSHQNPSLFLRWHNSLLMPKIHSFWSGFQTRSITSLGWQ